ncbi:MAG: septal ring lytic transglycosylase RlpA family protein [Bacteroidota bacterium]
MKVVLLAVAFLSTFCVSAQTFRWDSEKPHQTEETPTASTEAGTAMIYPDYYEGSPTALGEVFSQNELTGAHKKLPLGTVVQLTRLDNGMSVQVRINDRGAYCDGCIIDITKAAASQLGMIGERQIEVRLRVLGERKNAGPTMASISDEDEGRFQVRGVDQTQQRRAVPPTPNAYEPTSQSRIATPQVKLEEVPPSYEEEKDQPCIITDEYYAKGALGRTENGITVIDLPFSPFSVQFGAYTKRANAERHVKRLIDAGFDNVFMLQEERPGEPTLNRVIAAPFATYTEAKAYATQVQDYHDMRALVFQAKLVEVRE